MSHIHQFLPIDTIGTSRKQWHKFECSICGEKRRERISPLGNGLTDVEILKKGSRV